MDLRDREIGNKIRHYRKGKMTQQELAEKIGKTESSVRKYEKGLVTIPLNVLEQIASVLGVVTSDLMGFEYWEKKLIKSEAFIKYLETIGFYLDFIQEDECGENYTIILEKDGITTEYSRAEFEKFELEIQKSIDYQVWQKSKEKK